MGLKGDFADALAAWGSDGSKRKRADARRLPRCTLRALQDQHALRVPKAPGENRPPEGLSEAKASRSLTARPVPLARAAESAHSSDKLASPSLRSTRFLTGLYSAFANPLLERLGYGMANMRLISRDAGRWGQLFRCCSNGSAGVLLCRQVCWTQWAGDGLRRFFVRSDHGLPCVGSDNVPSGVTLAPEAWERGSTQMRKR